MGSYNACFVVFEKIICLCLFIPNSNQNHLITNKLTYKTEIKDLISINFV